MYFFGEDILAPHSFKTAMSQTDIAKSMELPIKYMYMYGHIKLALGDLQNYQDVR